MTRTTPSYTVILEQGEKPHSFGAYVPDLPGCVAVGSSLAEVRRLIRGAIQMHVDGMIEDGIPVPKSTTKTYDYGIAAKRVAARKSTTSLHKDPREAAGRKTAQKVTLGSKKRTLR